MNKLNINLTNNLIMFWRWSRLYQRQNDGYAMVMVSIMTILIFSMLSVYLFSTNLYRSSANAIVDGKSTFYAAEAGMNKRASKAHAKFLGFSQPQGNMPTGASVAEKMQSCMNGAVADQGTGDYACTIEDFDYYEQVGSATGSMQEARKRSKDDVGAKYSAYTFIQQNPRSLATYPESKKVPAGEPFAGLNALEYSYRVYATAVKRNNSGDASLGVGSQTLLQMDFNSRVIPLFQFAAFYENDLEINPSPMMSLNGPVHTNKNIFMAPGADLVLEGQVTSVNEMYNSLKVVANHARNDTPRIRVKIGAGANDYFDISTLIAWTEANHRINDGDISQTNGFLRSGISRLTVPDAGFLSKVDSTGKVGEYYSKADIQVEFTPRADLAQVPFALNISKNGGALPRGGLRSLRQPVLAAPTAANLADEQTLFCGSSIASTLTTSLTNAQKAQVANALAAAIASQPVPIAYSAMNQVLADTAPNNLRTTFTIYLNLIGVIGPDQSTLVMATPANIAALSGRCFLPAPLQVVTVNDRREGRNIQVLQTNIKSIVAWNRDGRYVDVNSYGGIDNNYAGQGRNIPGTLYTLAAADATAPALSYRKLGLSGSDRTEGGFVWHWTIDKVAYPYAAGKSVYGFAFSGANNLPAPLTIASDQALYLQGNYNTVDKQPAATMGDTIAVLSDACVDSDVKISCGNLNGGVLPVATPTTVNAAFLSRTDDTDTTQNPIRFSGGLNNYIRMLENWENVPLNYNGSFISLGTPLEFSGRYQPGKLGWGDLVNINDIDLYYYYFPPIRNYSFDTSFNFANQLPPLAPKVVYLKQKVFKRDFDSNRI